MFPSPSFAVEVAGAEKLLAGCAARHVRGSNLASMKLRRGQQQMTADLGLPRLTTPYVRENGELREASWDEALDRAASGFGAARDAIKGGNANAFGMFSCSKATNEVNYFGQKFARVVMGSNNIDSCNRT
jgi:anaerobic selenocysteine-containing dehydrogenase